MPSGREPLHHPSFAVLPAVAQAVMQPVPARLPEFDNHRGDQVAAPEVRHRHGGARRPPPFEFGGTLVELLTCFQHGGLPARPCAELRSPWPRMVVGLALLLGEHRDCPLHGHLALQRVPGEQDGRARAGSQILALAGRPVAVEGEAVLVEVLQQHGPRPRESLGGHGGEDHRVRLGQDFSGQGLGVLHPAGELLDRVLGQHVARQAIRPDVTVRHVGMVTMLTHDRGISTGRAAVKWGRAARRRTLQAGKPLIREGRRCRISNLALRESSPSRPRSPNLTKRAVPSGTAAWTSRNWPATYRSGTSGACWSTTRSLPAFRRPSRTRYRCIPATSGSMCRAPSPCWHPPGACVRCWISATSRRAPTWHAPPSWPCRSWLSRRAASACPWCRRAWWTRRPRSLSGS